MTDQTFPPLEAALAISWPVELWRDVHVVLAISGGADSVALLQAVVGMKREGGGSGRVLAAHFNHAARGEAAEEDQAWVEVLCRQLDVPLSIGRAASLRRATPAGEGWEEAARRARYEFLCTTAEEAGARYVAVAHTADDQVETVMHHILRGTGLTGLAGMPPVRSLSKSVSLVRPLLRVRRGDLLQYLDSLGQDYRIDATNDDRRWTRNRIRSELLPALRERYNANVDGAVLRLAQQAREAQAVIADLAEAIAVRSVEIRASEQEQRIRIDCRAFTDVRPIVAREVCRAAWSRVGWPMQSMGFDQWQQLAELLAVSADGRSTELPGGVRAWRENECLVIEQIPRLNST